AGNQEGSRRPCIRWTTSSGRSMVSASRLHRPTPRPDALMRPPPFRRDCTVRSISFLVAFLAAPLLLALAADTEDLDSIMVDGRSCGLEGKPGGSPGQQDLNRHKNRYEIPDPSDIDPGVSMPAMLAPGNDAKRFDQEKAATIKAFVINVKEGGKESCNCEASKPDDIDTHIELGLAADAPETQRVIVEV